MPIEFRKDMFLLLAAMLITTGCASNSTSSTYSDPSKAGEAYNNFLVIGVAGDYNSRAQFERSVVSGIKALGASASAYHVAVGGNKPLTREFVREAVARGAFDAVVVTRVIDRDADVSVKSTVTGTKVTRKEGGVLDLFRYDYEELDEPISLTVDMKITFATELYSAASESLVWSSESTGPRADHIGELIDNTADSVVTQIRRAGLVSR